MRPVRGITLPFLVRIVVARVRKWWLVKNYWTLEPDVVCLVGQHRFAKGRGGKTPLYMVLHHNAGVNTTEGLRDFWNNARAASAHYQIESSGRIGQLVWDRDTAYHAANFKVNQESIGVEVSNSGYADKDWPISDEALEESAHWSAALHVFYKWGRPEWGETINPHEKYANTSCPYHLRKGGKYHNRWMERVWYWYDVMLGVPPMRVTKQVAPKSGDVIVTGGVAHPMGKDTGVWRVSSGFGKRGGGFHRGVDFAAPLGTQIYAPADGVVIEGKDRAAGSVTGFGNWVWLDCQGSVGRDFIFGHMRHHEIYVRKGDRVKAGQLIARVGNEGQSSGPHLHFEVWTAPGRVGGQAVDPAVWLAEKVRSVSVVDDSSSGGLTVSEKQEILAEIRASEQRVKTYVSDFIKGFCGAIGSDVKDVRQQLTNSRDRGEYPGWGQLGDRTLTDALGAIGEVLNVPDMYDTLGKVSGVVEVKEK